MLRTELLSSENSSGLESFYCGDDDLDDFLKSDALKLFDEHVCVTFLAFLETDDIDNEFVGFISLVADALTLDSSEKLPDIPLTVVPALKIARLAVSSDARSRFKGIGTTLVRKAFLDGLDLTHSVAARFLTVDAYPNAISFYEKLGFQKNLAQTYKKRRRNCSMRLDLFGELPAWLDI